MPTYTDRLFLRNVHASDIHQVHKIMSMPKVYQYYGVEILTTEDAQRQMEWYQTHHQENTGVFIAICDKNTKELLGVLGVYKDKIEQTTAQIGFWISPDYWGKGLVYEAAKTLLPIVFKQLNLHRLEAEVETQNTQSATLLKKLNFQLESTKKECEFKNDQYIDIQVYRLFQHQI